MIDRELEISEDGLVSIRLRDTDLIYLQEVLSDGITSRPPKGAAGGDGPTTYWIDRAISDLRERINSRSAQWFAHGNIAYLRLRDGLVEARLDVDPPDSDFVDRVDPEDLLDLLTEWRACIVEFEPKSVERVR